MRALRRQVLDVQPAAERAEVQAAIQLRRRGETITVEHWRALSPVDRGRADMHAPTFNAKVKATAERRMKTMDSWPADVREVANELGFSLVCDFYQAGVKTGSKIRALVNVARGLQSDGVRPGAYGNRRVGKDS